MAMDIESYLKKSRTFINNALDKYLPPSNREPRTIHRAMRYSIFTPGKRIRPIIVLEAFRACLSPEYAREKRRLKDALVMACAAEIVHTYSLIHDDLPSMDDDDYRRGALTCHKVFGEANAILAGDALLIFAFNLLSKHINPRIGIRAVEELSDAIGIGGMVGGQAIDISYKGRSPAAAVRENVNRLKTARLFSCCAKLGAIAACSSERNIRAMAIYGEYVGATFQIVDDIMDRKSNTGSRWERDSHRRAREATDRAKRSLRIFGDGAARLRGIADLLLDRHI